MSHSLMLVTQAATKWPHAQAKSWQCIPEMKLDREVMVMSPNECSSGSDGLHLRGFLLPNQGLESKAPSPKSGTDSILQSKEHSKETK